MYCEINKYNFINIACINDENLKSICDELKVGYKYFFAIGALEKKGEDKKSRECCALSYSRNRIITIGKIRNQRKVEKISIIKS